MFNHKFINKLEDKGRVFTTRESYNPWSAIGKKLFCYILFGRFKKLCSSVHINVQ